MALFALDIYLCTTLPSPPGIPWAFDSASCPGRGEFENLNVALEGWGVGTRFISCSGVIRP